MVTTNINWLSQFKNIGMIWQHDGNPARPYAKLTSGLISDGFVNCTRLIERPRLLDEAVRDLIGRYRAPAGPCTIVGQAMGSVTIGSHIASALDARYCWTVKLNNTSMCIDKRFGLIAHNDEKIAVEDVVSTGGTTKKTVSSLMHAQTRVAPYIYTLVNRSGLRTIEVDGHHLEIRALLTLDIKSWEWGQNPHIKGGMERVEAVRPKENWDVLTREYPPVAA